MIVGKVPIVAPIVVSEIRTWLLVNVSIFVAKSLRCWVFEFLLSQWNCGILNDFPPYMWEWCSIVASHFPIFPFVTSPSARPAQLGCIHGGTGTKIRKSNVADGGRCGICIADHQGVVEVNVLGYRVIQKRTCGEKTLAKCGEKMFVEKKRFREKFFFINVNANMCVYICLYFICMFIHIRVIIYIY